MVVIENELQCCFEQTLEFGAKDDSNSALCSRLDVEGITLKDSFKSSLTMNRDMSGEER
jgi:hypothetical protein